MSWSDDVRELTEKIINRYSVPADYEDAVEAAILAGLKRGTENWCKQNR